MQLGFPPGTDARGIVQRERPEVSQALRFFQPELKFLPSTVVYPTRPVQETRLVVSPLVTHVHRFWHGNALASGKAEIPHGLGVDVVRG